MNMLFEMEDLARVPGPLHLAVGVFDGLHLGHQAVIDLAKKRRSETGGEVVVITFDPHPAAVLAPHRAPRILTSPRHKARLLYEVANIRHLLVIRFDEEFAAMPAEEFIRGLVQTEQIASISVGRDFRFGKGRAGDVALLERLGRELGFEVHAAGIVETGGTVISSTRIRAAIEEGDLPAAAALLGRPYRVLGTVVEGRKLGRTIGFPTANLAVQSEPLPPPGVYAARAFGNADSWDGVANLGYRPTVESGGPRLLLEVHLFGLDHEIYGEDLEVEFVRFLRAEQKFSGLDELRAQIARDSLTAREVLGSTAGSKGRNG